MHNQITGNSVKLCKICEHEGLLQRQSHIGTTYTVKTEVYMGHSTTWCPSKLVFYGHSKFIALFLGHLENWCPNILVFVVHLKCV